MATDPVLRVLAAPTDLTAPVLVHALSGFVDAGASGRLATEHLLATLAHTRVATADIDRWFDYRARRPRTLFVADHYERVDLPELVVDRVTDAAGTDFLLLHGVEPDLGWQQIVDETVALVGGWGVRLCVGMHAIPWPAPHTRPVGITAHGTDPDLVRDHLPWVGAIEIPGSLAGLLELRLGQAGHPAIGFAAHVPHYLAGSEHPRAALALLQAVVPPTGLTFPLDDLRAAADAVDAATDEQVQASQDNAAAVQALEAQYDAVQSERTRGEGMRDGPLPSADEIAAQVERFLAGLDTPGLDDH